MCYMTTTTTIYTAPSSIVPLIVSFSIPNAPIMSPTVVVVVSAPSASLRAFKDCHSSSLLPLPRSLLCRLVVLLMPPPLILSTLPPPLNVQPRPIEAPSPLVRWRFSSRLPLVCRLVVASTSASALRHLLSRSCCTRLSLTPPFCSRQLVVASHCLRLLMRRCLTTGCVVVVANAQA